MLDGATNIFDWCVGFVFKSLTQEQIQIPDEERWVPVDRAHLGSMSLFQCEKKGQMGVFYSNSIDPASLEHAYQQIQESIPIDGTKIASTLLEPFQGYQTGNIEDSWLGSEVIDHFFRTLENKEVATVDSGLYHGVAFIDSLDKKERQRLFNKLQNANLTLWPVCLGSHWYLMMIEKFEGNTFTINVIDGNNNKGRHAEIASQGKALLTKVYGESRFRILNESHPSCTVPLQDNPIDCGPAIAFFALQRTRRESLWQYGPFENRSCNYVQFRMHMAFEIARVAVANVVELRRTPSPNLLPQFSCSRAVKAGAATSKNKAEAERVKRAKVTKV